jgi:hypothetical protein
VALGEEGQKRERRNGGVVRVFAVAPGAIAVLLLGDPREGAGGRLLRRLVDLDLFLGARQRREDQKGDEGERKRSGHRTPP